MTVAIKDLKRLMSMSYKKLVFLRIYIRKINRDDDVNKTLNIAQCRVEWTNFVLLKFN